MRRPSLHRQHGAAVVELAFILVTMTMIFPAVLLFGRMFYQYQAVRQAVGDAARAVASAPSAILADNTLWTAEDTRIRQQLIRSAQAAGVDQVFAPYEILITCEGLSCRGITSGNISVSVTLRISDYALNAFTGPFFTGLQPEWDIPIGVTVPYAKQSASN